MFHHSILIQILVFFRYTIEAFVLQDHNRNSTITVERLILDLLNRCEPINPIKPGYTQTDQSSEGPQKMKLDFSDHNSSQGSMTDNVHLIQNVKEESCTFSEDVKMFKSDENIGEEVAENEYNDEDIAMKSESKVEELSKTSISGRGTKRPRRPAKSQTLKQKIKRKRVRKRGKMKGAEGMEDEHETNEALIKEKRKTELKNCWTVLPPVNPGVFYCILCSDSPRWNEELEYFEHLKSQHMEDLEDGGSGFKCTYCDSITTEQKLPTIRRRVWRKVLGRMYHHLLKKHGMGVPEFVSMLRCTKCNYLSANPENMMNHVKVCVLEEGRMICKKCGVELSNKGALEYHEKSHVSVKLKYFEPNPLLDWIRNHPTHCRLKPYKRSGCTATNPGVNDR